MKKIMRCIRATSDAYDSYDVHAHAKGESFCKNVYRWQRFGLEAFPLARPSTRRVSSSSDSADAKWPIDADS